MFLLVSVCCDTTQTLVFMLVSVCCDTAQTLVFVLVSLYWDTAQTMAGGNWMEPGVSRLHDLPTVLPAMTKVGISTSGREEASSASITSFSTDSRTSCREASAITTDKMMMDTGSSFVRPACSTCREGTTGSVTRTACS